MKNSRWRNLTILLPILLAGGVLRFGELGTYGPTPGDDISYLNEVRKSYGGLLRAMPDSAPWVRPFLVANNLTQRTYEGRLCFTSLSKPFYVFKLSLLESLGEVSLYQEQFANAVSGSLIVLVLYLLGAAVFSPAAGLIAAFLGAISPWLLHYSVYGIPTADSTLFLLLAVWLLVRIRFHPFWAGLAAGLALVFNPTVIFLAFAFVLLALVRIFLECGLSEFRPRKLVSRGLPFILGIALPWVAWEGGNAFYWSFFGQPHRSFWEALTVCRQDNLLHSLKLPVDSLFALRLVAVSEGWPQLLLWLTATAWGAVRMLRRERSRRFPLGAVWAMMVSTIVAASFTGITQCARHYVLFWPLGLTLIGGLLAALLSRSRPRRVLVLCLLGACTVSTAVSLANYRAARQAWHRLSAWLEENIPPGRVVTPSNQPGNMWPTVPRFSTWSDLERLEAERGPTWVVYGDYMAISRGIWDYPREMFPIALACRQVEGEDFRTPSHLGSPIFLYENEDYYWGFVRQPLRNFDPDVRVIPTSRLLEIKDRLEMPPDIVSSPGRSQEKEPGSNVYLPFIEYGVNHPRSPWPGAFAVFGLAGLLFLLAAPAPGLVRGWLVRRRVFLGVAAVLLLALCFRSWGISLFAPLGGDDVEYQSYVNQALNRFGPSVGSWAAPLSAASVLSQLDVNRTITVFAKPFFILERVLLAALLGGDFCWAHYMACLYGVLSVLLVFFLGRRLGGNPAGFSAALIWAVSPWAATYSTWGLHVAGGALLFGLSLWAYLAFRGNPRPRRALFSGLAFGAAVMYSTSNLFPVIFLVGLEAISSVCRLLRKSGCRRLFSNWGMLALGAVIPLGVWEAVSRFGTGLVGQGYRSFPEVLLAAVRDNVLHATALPVDLLFFWRHLFLSEGLLLGGVLTLCALWGFWRLFRGRAGKGEGTLLVLLFGLTVVMNYTGITQVIRHFFPALFPLALLAGLVVARLLARFPRASIPLLLLFAILIPGRWKALEPFRENRWAPSRIQAWSSGHLYNNHRTGTIPCQLMEIWPHMVRLNSWRDLAVFAGLAPPGVFMYGDYIELSLGSWVFSFPEYYEISEVARNLERSRDLFRTPSYLNYLPTRFENEFYYWGLYRNRPDDFDPYIRMIPAPDLVEKYKKIRANPLEHKALWDATRPRPPLAIPARGKAIYRPFMGAIPRPDYTVHLVLALLVFLGLGLAVVREKTA